MYVEKKVHHFVFIVYAFNTVFKDVPVIYI